MSCLRRACALVLAAALVLVVTPARVRGIVYGFVDSNNVFVTLVSCFP